MYDARATALAANDFAFFALPPNGPSRSGRRHEGSTGPARRLIRAIRSELTRLAEEAPSVLPRITNYPY
jgi:hypothetical protein